MATLAEVESAFMKADAAGDTDAARVLAGEVRRLRAEPQSPPPTPTQKFNADAKSEESSLPGPLDFLSSPAASTVRTVKELGKALYNLPQSSRDAATRNFHAGQGEVPQWARNNPSLYGGAQVIRDLFGPTVEGVASAAGAVAGTPGGPVGNVAGAGLGYGIGKGVTRAADDFLGNTKSASAVEAVTRGAGDVAEGAAWQAGGNIVGQQVVPLLGKAAGYVGGKVADIGQLGTQKAADIARQALGKDLDAVKAALTDTPLYGQKTAGELTANINNPLWQALVARGLGRDPAFTRAAALAIENNDKATLMRLAGGNTQTAAIGAQQTAKGALNARLVPVLDTEMKAANTAGEMLPKLEGEAQRMANAAAAKVEDVRRMTAAGGRAAERANTTTGQAALTAVPGYPRQPGRYTYMGELEKKAEQVAQQAADASLPFGEASRFARAAADSLEAHGLRPLTAESILSKLGQIERNPKFAGLAEMDAALSKLGDDLVKWTKSGGVIDAWAVDSIRKNSVNGAIKKLNPNMDASQQKKLAASVMAEIKPMLIRAIEGAGGTGYGGYLRDWAKGSHVIDQQQMAAKALELYNTNPGSLAKLMEGDAPKRVEKIFGSGRIDVRKEMLPDVPDVDLRTVIPQTPVNAMDEIARGVRIRETAAAQAKFPKVEEQLQGLLEDNITKYKFPFMANVKATVANQVLAKLENELGKNTMKAFTEAFKSGKGTQELLNMVPGSKRVEVLRLLSELGPMNQSTLNVGVPTVRGLFNREEPKQGLLAN